MQLVIYTTFLPRALISAMCCSSSAASLGVMIVGLIPEQVNVFLTSNFFVIDYRASVDAGLARTKCFLFVKTFFIWQNALFKQIHIACRLGKIGHYRRL